MYGALTASDAMLLERILRLYSGSRVRFLEIGVHTGQTARGIREFCESIGARLEYWGIDSGVQNDGRPPFDGAHMVVADSAEAAHLVPDEFDVVLCDGCHCFNHVILDTVLYGEKVVDGGYILHHDTASHVQQTMPDPHGPRTPRFSNSVVDALRSIRWPFPEWEFSDESTELGTPWGGMTAHRKREHSNELK